MTRSVRIRAIGATVLVLLGLGGYATLGSREEATVARPAEAAAATLDDPVARSLERDSRAAEALIEALSRLSARESPTRVDEDRRQ